MTLCPYKWCLYFVTAWLALYYMLESLKWYQDGEKGRKMIVEDDLGATAEGEWDSEEEEEEDDTLVVEGRRVKVE